jgi:hypothetical protein
VQSLNVYERSVGIHFERVFGQGPFTIVAHLPGYASDSSLVYMLQYLIRVYGNVASGFFVDDVRVLREANAYAAANGQVVVLFGAAFGLLQLVDSTDVRLTARVVVIETGGMKLRDREIDRLTLHRQLAAGFGIPRERVWSEYGMCELLSQCYTRGGEVFYPPPWMRFRIVDAQDPRNAVPDGTPGLLLVFDLANVYSVSALMTSDLAVGRGSGFEVIGRMRGSDLRGCNFLLDEYISGERE